jgi:hypothetical protein
MESLGMIAWNFFRTKDQYAVAPSDDMEHIQSTKSAPTV